MKFYPYWVKATERAEINGYDWKVERYGWSSISREDALRRAKELLQESMRFFRDADTPGGYPYSDRPVREEIIQELPGVDGQAAVITRNAYGSLVLNTAKVLFADIDKPRQKSIAGGLGRLIGSLFGKKTPEPEPIDPIVARVEQFFNDSRDLGARLYRTAAGYRCLITSHVFDPLSQETSDLLTALGSDPLYIKLCNVQECFRARLSPKPWRCGIGNPPHRFPWDDSEKEAAMRTWEAQYNTAAQAYGICELVGSHGNSQLHPQVAPLVKLHDGMTCKDGARLA
jgi:hypothetical protein